MLTYNSVNVFLTLITDSCCWPR